MEKRRGYYYGSLSEGKWWKRVWRAGLGVRGNGLCWSEKDAFYFRTYLIRVPIRIPFSSVEELRVAGGLAGRRGGGAPSLRVSWFSPTGDRLVSGFRFGKTPEEFFDAVAELFPGMALRRPREDD